MKRLSRKRIINTRLRAFTSFSDNFSSASLKSGWKSLSGSWTSGGNLLTASSVNSLISIPLSKSDCTITATLPSGTGMGVYFWGLDANNYWASYAVSSGTTTSTCTNNACNGTENYTVTQNCSCYQSGTTTQSTCNNGACSGSENFTDYRSCSCSAVSVSNCNNGSCSGSENYTATRSCSCGPGPSNCNNGSCSGAELFADYRTCSCYYSGGVCSYTAGSTTYTSLGCYSAFSGCNSGTETSCNGPGGLNVCGCPCGQSKVCCYTVTTTSGYYNCAVGCSYNGQYNSQCYFNSTCNSGACSGGEWFTNSRSCSCPSVSNCNNGSCSGTENYTATRSCSCSSVNVSNCNSGACNGGEFFTNTRSCSCPTVPVYASTCNNGACSGTYSFTATRNCSCTTTYSRKLRTVKVINGVQSTVSEFNISSLPTSIQIVTSGTSVSVSGSGSSANYTNSDGTTNKNFGIIRVSGGSEEISSISNFTATVA
jgi:hypothetical protein